ncbi:hypothetical protein N7456_001799 [Penicillium angulare]|uniref:RING-type domain-containing protein n=1 Tax=Penicillium angulare TaxID=116970 RepID=A0A9W9KP70_9EURO|nr:hypothetical protein N7456_001799 [Penicillium angulare]
MGPLIILAFFAVSVLATVTVSPSNNSQDLSAFDATHFRLHADGPLNGQTIAPLTQHLLQLTETDLKAFAITGNLTKVVASDSVGLNSSSIACIPCDSEDYPGPLKAANTINNVDSADNPPGAIILYSASASHCNFTADDAAEGYHYIFTVLNLNSSTDLQDIFGSTNTTATINSMASYNQGDMGTGDPSGSTGSGGGPNTAMIILYSITGIITALFLGIIVTGAVRAHRHPERYGPRRVAGRPRQSRARGIARAMLEGIPIVKFGDEPHADTVDAAKRDIEMASTEQDGREHSPPRSENDAEVGETTPHETEAPAIEQEANRPKSTVLEPRPDAAPDAGNFSCPICTDDFIKGQDLRVLPCYHQFHPECVDPWLVNVSGTCPLCRIDLNPPKAEDGEEGENGENAEGTNAENTATATPETPAPRHSHNPITNYLTVRRMRNATVEERIAALRHVREANQDDATQDSAPTPNRSRLSTRFRERFRIRTRAHGVDGSSPIDSGASTPAAVASPTVPPPAHITENESESETPNPPHSRT